MKTGAIVYGAEGSEFVWADLAKGVVLGRLRLAASPVVEAFPELDLLLVSYEDFRGEELENRVDVLRLSTFEPLKQFSVECRAHFNVAPTWSTFLLSRDGRSIWAYQSQGLGDHLGADYIAALDVATLEWRSERRRIPECIGGWSACRDAEAQVLYVSDGLEVGELPQNPPDERLVFWNGPDGGFSEPLSLGPRPRAHSELGHARAILASRERSLSVVVKTDGELRLVDSAERRPLERQRADLPEGYAMPIFAAQLDPEGRRLYVGASRPSQRALGATETIIVHDLDAGRSIETWKLDSPLQHMSLSSDGRTLFGALDGETEVAAFDVRDGRRIGGVDVGGEALFLTAA